MAESPKGDGALIDLSYGDVLPREKKREGGLIGMLQRGQTRNSLHYTSVPCARVALLWQLLPFIHHRSSIGFRRFQHWLMCGVGFYAERR